MVIYKFKYGLYEALISTVTISLTHFAQLSSGNQHQNISCLG